MCPALFTETSRVTKTDLVLQYLRDALARGEIEPGQPVREALRRAQISGMVQYAAYRGVTVSELATADIVELYRIRGRLEPLATELATPKLSETTLIELERLNEELRRHAGGGRVAETQAANDRWHDLIYQAADSPRLYGLINALISGCPRDTFSIPGRAELSAGEHGQILIALRHREPQLAATLMEGHIVSAVASFLEARGAAAQEARVAA